MIPDRTLVHPWSGQVLLALLLLLLASSVVLAEDERLPNAVGSAAEIAVPFQPTSILLGTGLGARFGYERHDLFGVPLLAGVHLGYRFYFPEAQNVRWFQTVPLTIAVGYRVAVAPRFAAEARVAVAYSMNTLRYAGTHEELASGTLRTDTGVQPEAGGGFSFAYRVRSDRELRLDADYRVLLEPAFRFGSMSLRFGARRFFADARRARDSAPGPAQPEVTPRQPARVLEEAESADDGGERPPADEPPREPEAPVDDGEPAQPGGPVAPTRTVADDAVDTALRPRDADGAPTAGQAPTSTLPTSSLPADPPADAPVAARVTPTSVSLDLQVFFEPFSAVVTEAAREQLDRLAAYLEQYRANRIQIIGHVAAVGDPTLNQPLSEERAFAVREYLVSVHGFRADALVAAGRGGDEPVADNATPEGRALNRRVEIVVDVSSPNDDESTRETPADRLY